MPNETTNSLEWLRHFEDACAHNRAFGSFTVTPAEFEKLEKHAGACRAEIEGLRALVTRLTNVAENLAGELSDPGTEALAAIHCGRNFIYG